MTEACVVGALHDAAPDVPFAVTYGAHHSTYSALARQLVKEGVDFPADLLGIYVGKVVEVSAT